jgi:hypothetical protein
MLLRCLVVLLCAVAAMAAGKEAKVKSDPRIRITGVKYVSVGKAGRGVEFEIVNKGNSAIVAWAPFFDRAASWLEQMCPDGRPRVDRIEPGTARRVLIDQESCSSHRLKRIAAIFADGSWTRGPYEEGVFGDYWRAAVCRLVAQRWLLTLRSLQTAPDPVDSMGGLMPGVEFQPDSAVVDLFSSSLSSRSSRFLKDELDSYALMYLRIFVQRCYNRTLNPEISRNATQKTRRDRRAENRLKQRPDAKQQITYALEREIRMVERRIEDLTWVTMFTPEYKFLGMPTIMPPPSQVEPGGLKTRPGKVPSE